MSEVSYDQFLVEVLPYVRDVPEIVAIQAIRNAVIQFCEKTLYLQTDLDPQPVIKGLATYDLDPDGDYKVVDIIESWNADQFLIPKSVEELTKIYRVTNWETLVGNPYYYYRPTPDEMRLVPIPEKTIANNLRIKVALAPKRSSTTIRDDIYERFLEFISLGARARLLDTPNQPYYDPKGAQLYLKRFDDACADVRRRVNRGNVRASNRVEFQRFV